MGVVCGEDGFSGVEAVLARDHAHAAHPVCTGRQQYQITDAHAVPEQDLLLAEAVVGLAGQVLHRAPPTAHPHLAPREAPFPDLADRSRAVDVNPPHLRARPHRRLRRWRGDSLRCRGRRREVTARRPHGLQKDAVLQKVREGPARHHRLDAFDKVLVAERLVKGDEGNLALRGQFVVAGLARRAALAAGVGRQEGRVED